MLLKRELRWITDKVLKVVKDSIRFNSYYRIMKSKHIATFSTMRYSNILLQHHQ
jgi:hypothetical protein